MRRKAGIHAQQSYPGLELLKKCYAMRGRINAREALQSGGKSDEGERPIYLLASQ